ncbi:MAG: glucose-6-phosphate isomerase family protein [Patescibacteria group bacterium]|mgnify:CR=1 FL=1
MRTEKKYSDKGIKGNAKNVIVFGNKERVPSVRFVKDMEEVILDKEWVENNKTEPLYYMYRDLSKSEKDAAKIKAANLRFDILDSLPIFLGKEFNKTAGHYHSIVDGTKFAYPEIYEILNGEVYYLMQKTNGDKVEDVYAIKATSNDKVIVPPNYGHFTIFLSNNSVRMSNWISNSSLSDYDRVKQKHGASYYALIDKNAIGNVRWVKNENYSQVPALRFLKPTNFKDFGLVKTINMYDLVNDLKKLDYLNNPQNYPELWNRVLNNK